MQLTEERLPCTTCLVRKSWVKKHGRIMKKDEPKKKGNRCQLGLEVVFSRPPGGPCCVPTMTGVSTCAGSPHRVGGRYDVLTPLRLVEFINRLAVSEKG